MSLQCDLHGELTIVAPLEVRSEQLAWTYMAALTLGRMGTTSEEEIKPGEAGRQAGSKWIQLRSGQDERKDRDLRVFMTLQFPASSFLIIKSTVSPSKEKKLPNALLNC